MKKLLLASAVAALSITAAQAAPTVYGKAFLTLDIQDGDKNSPAKDSRSQLNSTGSRIGFKGSEALTASTDLVYQLEYRLDIDDDVAKTSGDKVNFEARDTYIGLSNKQYGTLVAGRLSAIDDYINYAKVVQGGVVGGDDVLASVSGPRVDNAFAYFSPSYYNSVQFMGMYALDEDKDPKDNYDTLGGDAFGVGVKYEPENAPVKVGLTYIKASQAGYTLNSAGEIVDSTGAIVNNVNGKPVKGKNLQTVRLSGAYAVNPALTVAGQYQFTDYNSKKDEHAFTVSGKYKVAQTSWTAYGQVDVVDNLAGIKDAEKQRIALGGQYAFNKNTTGHVYGAFMKDEQVVSNVKTDYDSYGVGAGLEYKF